MPHILQALFKDFGTNPLFAIMCAGAIPLLFALERRTSPWIAAALLTLAAVVLNSRFAPPPAPYFGARILAWLGEAGASAAVVLGFLSIRRARCRIAFGIFLTVVLSNWVTGKYLEFTGTAMPVTFDRVMAVADSRFGLQPSFAVGRLFEALPALHDFAFLTYNALLFALLLLCALRLRDHVRSAVELLVQFLAAGAAGSLLYALLPVCGPVYSFPHDFPRHDPVLTAADAAPRPLPPAPRNGVPSLHFTWALLFFLASGRHSRAVRALYSVFLAGTFLATIGTGEHYFLDLVIAVPFACAIAGIREDFPTRVRTLLTPAALVAATLAWMLLLRTDPKLLLPPFVVPAACLLTVAASVYLWTRRLPPFIAKPALTPNQSDLDTVPPHS